MAFSAVEVFPKECMGGLSLERVNGSMAVGGFATPYQIARRKLDEVASDSGAVFSLAVEQLADFHSHPKTGRQPEIFNPSETDLANMDVGDIEIILSIKKSKISMSYLHQTARGTVTASLGRYRLIMNAFLRLDGDPDEKCYKRIKMAMRRV